jgi:hypothetical protein
VYLGRNHATKHFSYSQLLIIPIFEMNTTDNGMGIRI